MMTILFAALACFAVALAAYFLLLMGDGRRLRERMRDRRPAFMPEEPDSETPLIAPDDALWIAQSFGSPAQPRAEARRALYSTTPEPPGLS